MTLLSWSYPENNELKANIDTLALYPITTLTKREKHQLLKKNIVLVKESANANEPMKSIGISEVRIQKVLTEVQKLCQNNPNEKFPL